MRQREHAQRVGHSYSLSHSWLCSDIVLELCSLKSRYKYVWSFQHHPGAKKHLECRLKVTSTGLILNKFAPIMYAIVIVWHTLYQVYILCIHSKIFLHMYTMYT